MSSITQYLTFETQTVTTRAYPVRSVQVFGLWTLVHEQDTRRSKGTPVHHVSCERSKLS